MKRYAEVSVNSPIAQRRAFSYTIPAGLDIGVGQAVWVPFGEKLLQGIVLELTDVPAVSETREIAGIIDPRPVLLPHQIKLARWLSDYYLTPLFASVALQLPPAFERKALTFVTSPAPPADYDPASLEPEARRVVELVRQHGRVNLKDLEKSLGKRPAQSLVVQLTRRNLLARTYEPESVRVKVKTVPYIGLAVTADVARQEADRRRARAGKQASLLDFLAEAGQPVPVAEARKRANCGPQTVTALVDAGLATVNDVEVKREPLHYPDGIPSSPLTLTADQAAAFREIQVGLSQPAGASPRVFLLHGVTGSGKTEIYLRALAEAVKLGKRGIVLVPEIALTPQTIDRFVSRFPRRVAVLHSKLSPGEQFDEWRRIRDGGSDVVIGARSALFAPQPDLGLIVIDEEHEWSYKQENPPRYHTRDVAIKLAELTGAVVLLGSATPDVTTFYRARQGDYRLLSLPQRVTPDEGSPLPPASIIDMRDELKAGNTGLFSRALSEAMTQALAGGEQVLLFLNRRGGANFVQCRNCGFVFRCKRCYVSLNYHFDTGKLVCHQCNYRMSVPQFCPQCHRRRLTFVGTGTQKVEVETSGNFPQARLLRWDSDTATGKDAHREIMDKFRKHEADILIGTQMIAKGLDLPLITVVGVVNADTGVNLPDFRAGERTFQLLAQVAGRTGRGSAGGQVVIQTYSPQHYAIQAAAKQDYALFYEKEIIYRRQLQLPPFTRLARLVYSHTNEARAQQEAIRMGHVLISEKDARGIAGLSLIGPAPAFFYRVRGHFRWQLILRGTELSAFLSAIAFPEGWTVDIDPLGLV